MVFLRLWEGLNNGFKGNSPMKKTWLPTADGTTDQHSYRDAWTHLKTFSYINKNVTKMNMVLCNRWVNQQVDGTTKVLIELHLHAMRLVHFGSFMASNYLKHSYPY